MMGQYMLGYAAGWLWMCLMMMLMVIGWVVFLVAVWRMMKAKESIAISLADLSKQLIGEKQKIELP